MTATVARAASGGDRDRGDRAPRAREAVATVARARSAANDDGPAPEFAPAFLTRDDD